MKKIKRYTVYFYIKCYISFKSTLLEDFKLKKNIFLNMQILCKLDTGGVVFKIKEVPSPQRSLEILFFTNFFRNVRKMMLRK